MKLLITQRETNYLDDSIIGPSAPRIATAAGPISGTSIAGHGKASTIKKRKKLFLQKRAKIQPIMVHLKAAMQINLPMG